MVNLIFMERLWACSKSAIFIFVLQIKYETASIPLSYQKNYSLTSPNKKRRIRTEASKMFYQDVEISIKRFLLHSEKYLQRSMNVHFPLN